MKLKHVIMLAEDDIKWMVINDLALQLFRIEYKTGWMKGDFNKVATMNYNVSGDIDVNKIINRMCERIKQCAFHIRIEYNVKENKILMNHFADFIQIISTI